MPVTRPQLLDKFDALQIATTTYDHEAVFTVEESQTICSTIEGGHSKNLFLKDKKGNLFLLTAWENTQVDLKNLHKLIQSGRLSFGKPELLMEYIGVVPGSVSPFGLINDVDGHVSFFIDDKLMGYEWINFHPLENTATTQIHRDDFLKFMKEIAHEPTIITL